MADLGSLLGSAGIGGAIGKAIVSLELDTKKYMAELQGAEAQTIASTNKSSSAFGSFGKFASSALLGVGVAAVAGAAMSVKAAIEANDAHLKLQNTFANNASLSDSSVEAFEEQAESLRALTGVDDEAIISGQALLGSMNRTGAEVMQLTPLIVDLASKYDIDLTSAFKAVGKAADGNTGALARYVGAIEAGETPAEDFQIALDALGKSAGFAADSAEAEPWRVLASDLEELSEQLGQALLPLLTEFASSLVGVVKNLGPLLDLLGKLGPVVEGVAFVFGKMVSPLATVINLLSAGVEPTDEMIDLLGNVAAQTLSAADAAHKGADALQEQAEATDEVVQSMREQLDAQLALADSTFGLISATRDNRTAEHELAAAHRLVNRLEAEGKDNTKAYAEAKADLRAKALAAAESEVGLASAVRRLQQEIASGKTDMDTAIANIKDIGKEAGLSGADIRKLVNDVQAGLGGAAALAKRLAGQLGKDISQGIANGIDATAPSIVAAAESAVLRAMAAARTAAQAKSPSKKMHELGVDMMVGLANGISDAEQKAIDATRKAMEKVIDQVSSQLDKIKSKASSFADTIKGGFSGFLNIGGAFGSAEEGTSLSDVISAQVGGAQTLADVLEALKRQGASKGLLAQVAESGSAFGQAILQGGPEQVKEMNNALKTIADLAQETGKGLSEDFFGKSIDRVEKKLDKLHDDLRELNQLEREGHSHDIVVDGQKLAEATRKQLIKTGNRNGDALGPNG